ncbi:MAG: restriction endonuclease subunit S [Azoarcus sp.]|jgi:type I restriction enzyme S subunit|nr:restriction endonuclease subunit S [Azoarcus sp.]
MTYEWQEVRLGELGEVNRGRSRHRPRNAPHLYGGEYPFIQTGNIKAANGRITSHSQTYSDAGLAQSRLWPAGTMAITIAANIAETAILTYPACFPDSVVGFVADEKKADVRFIEYLFRSLRQQIQHEHVGTGSVQDNINLQTLERLALNIPPLAEQRTIAEILGSLDDRIDNLRQTNATLEAIAAALFKSWFVDFDGVPQENMQESELGLIPKEWRVGRLDEVFEINPKRELKKVSSLRTSIWQAFQPQVLCQTLP